MRGEDYCVVVAYVTSFRASKAILNDIGGIFLVVTSLRGSVCWC